MPRSTALQHVLLATGDAVLAEAAPNDSIWSIGIVDAGTQDPERLLRIQDPGRWPPRAANILGWALMEVRRALWSPTLSPAALPLQQQLAAGDSPPPPPDFDYSPDAAPPAGPVTSASAAPASPALTAPANCTACNLSLGCLQCVMPSCFFPAGQGQDTCSAEHRDFVAAHFPDAPDIHLCSHCGRFARLGRPTPNDAVFDPTESVTRLSVDGARHGFHITQNLGDGNCLLLALGLDPSTARSAIKEAGAAWQSSATDIRPFMPATLAALYSDPVDIITCAADTLNVSHNSAWQAFVAPLDQPDGLQHQRYRPRRRG